MTRTKNLTPIQARDFANAALSRTSIEPPLATVPFDPLKSAFFVLSSAAVTSAIGGFRPVPVAAEQCVLTELIEAGELVPADDGLFRVACLDWERPDPMASRSIDDILNQVPASYRDGLKGALEAPDVDGVALDPLPDLDQPAVVLAAYAAELPAEVLRPLLLDAWAQRYELLLNCAFEYRPVGTSVTDLMAAMFSRVRDESTLSHLPETVQVWRGAYALSASAASDGISWTTNRDIACWFAYRSMSRGHGVKGSRMLVVTAHVPRTQIAMFIDDRSEAEAVMPCPPIGRIDPGGRTDWLACAKRFEEMGQSDSL